MNLLMDPLMQFDFRADVVSHTIVLLLTATKFGSPTNEVAAHRLANVHPKHGALDVESAPQRPPRRKGR